MFITDIYIQNALLLYYIAFYGIMIQAYCTGNSHNPKQTRATNLIFKMMILALFISNATQINSILKLRLELIQFKDIFG